MSLIGEYRRGIRLLVARKGSPDESNLDKSSFEVPVGMSIYFSVSNTKTETSDMVEHIHPI